MMNSSYTYFDKNATEVKVSSSHYITSKGWFMMLICLITDDINFDYLVKEVSVMFLYCQVTIFTFVIKMYLEERIIITL